MLSIECCLLCSRLLFRPGPLCRECQVSFLTAELHWREEKDLPVFSLFQYVEPVDQWMKMWKNPKYHQTLSYFAAELAKKFSFECLSSVSGVIPMPAKENGTRDHAYVIAETLAQYFKAPLASQFLARSGGPGPQKEKSRDARQNLKLRLLENFSRHTKTGEGLWLLVDDVVTTGSTLETAWNLLGRPPAVGLTLASRPRFFDLGLPPPKPSGDWGSLIWQ